MTAPLFLLGGAPGSGKTALVPHLARLADGLVVLEMDDLLEDGRLLGVPIATPDAADVWPAYNRLWSRLAGLIRRSGVPVLLLCPLLPAEAAAAGLGVEDDVHWALLDCAEEEQASRLRARGWTAAQIADAITDARAAREAISTRFRTDTTPPAETARRVLAWLAASRQTAD